MVNQIVLLPIVLAVIVTFLLFTNPLDETFLGYQLENFIDVNWNDVKPRNTIKNTVPLELIEDQGSLCKVHSEKFHLITDHVYFKNAEKLIKDLNFDNSTSTLLVPCEDLPGDSSLLHVWYVVEESPKHANKYEYRITDLDTEPDFGITLEEPNTEK